MFYKNRKWKFPKDNVYFIYFVWFLMCLVLSMLVFWTQNKSLTTTADSFNFNYPIYVYTGEYLRDIPRQLFSEGHLKVFDFNIGYGNNVFEALCTGEMFDLFNLTSVFFPGGLSEFGYAFSFVLRLYFAGFNLLLFGKNRGFCDSSLVASGLTYAFLGYTLYFGLNFYNFMSALVALPLLALGVDRIMLNERKVSKALIVGLVMQITCGWLFAYMATVFFVLYIPVVFFASAEKKSIKEFLVRFLYILTHYVLVFAALSVVFIPDIYTCFLSPRYSNSLIDFNIIKQWYRGTAAWTRLNKMITPHTLQEDGLGLYIGVFSVLGIVQGVTVKKHIDAKIICAICLILYFCSGFSRIMNGFAYTSDRWVYIVNFAVCALMMVGIDSIDKYSKVQMGLLALLYGIWLYTIIKIEDSADILIARVAFFSVLWIIIFLLPRIIRNMPLIDKMIPALAVCSIVATYIIYFGPQSLYGRDETKIYRDNGVYRDIIASDFVQYSTKEASFRTDIVDTSLGASMIVNTRGCASYFTGQNWSAYEFLRFIGNSSSLFGTINLQGLDGRLYVETLMSVGTYKDGEKDNTIYHTASESLAGYLYDSYVSYEDASELDVLDINAMLMQHAIADASRIPNNVTKAKVETGADWEVIESEIDASEVIVNGTEYPYEFNGSNALYVRPKEAFMNDGQHEYYIVFEGLKSTLGIALINIEGKTIRFKPSLDTATEDGIFMMKIPMTESVVENNEICILPEMGNYTYDNIELRRMDISEYPQNYDKLTRNVTKAFEVVKSDTVSGSIDIDRDSILVMSIFYDESWKCYVDGGRQETLKIDNGLLGVCLPEGSHTVIWKYESFITNLCLFLGKIIMVAAIAAYIVVIYQKKKHRSSRHNKIDGR